jgi:Ca2+-transporting ATPase
MSPAPAVHANLTDSPLVAHALSAEEVLQQIKADTNGLNTDEVSARLMLFGPNRLAEKEAVPAWKRFAGQFTNMLTVILIVAAVVSLVVAKEVKTPIVVMTVVLINAIIGFVQENKAEASLNALKKMLASSARVRRNGELENVPTEQIVPGDIVLIEAGDRVPGDGRLLTAVNLEVEEASLTGESLASTKSLDPVAADASIGDRKCAVFMNTTVTRGRAEFVVTATGMNTEMGRIAGLLQDTETDKTPLQKQLDTLAHSLAKLAGVIVGVVFIIGLISGDEFQDLMLTAVALAAAAIPEGLPAVTAVTLAIGTSRMAKKNAIVKRLASVETLGCTSVICSDKTGTLTLNQMTARELVFMNKAHHVSGEGYSPAGKIETANGDDPIALITALYPMALCNDSIVRNDEGNEWELVGDPTEGAMVVLAMKGGIDVSDMRTQRPRLAEVPFDSAHKFMATFHQITTDEGHDIVRVFVKGAPDVLMQRSVRAIDGTGSAAPIGDLHADLAAHNERLASQGLRVLAVAHRDFDLEAWNEISAEDPISLVHELTFLALIGIIDPPRPEARDAIAIAHHAGISVKMITGDHAITAAAIGRDLGLTGGSVTGAELELMSEEELERIISHTSVFARVSPTHKIRLVTALQRKGNVVAMTGDGVNDAPALKKADIGVAMGITGTEVTKEAATMVLTDDNFATIVGAVERGRVIYDNIVKFVRFQLSTTLGFAMVFLASSLTGIMDRKPFTAIAILWVNIIMDGPPAMALGVDQGGTSVMSRTPRPKDEPILTRQRWLTVILSALVMAVATTLLFEFAPGDHIAATTASVAGTMGLNTFVLFQFFNILNVRSDSRSVFSRLTFTNKALWISLASVLALQIAVTHVWFMQNLFDTMDITLQQWLICIATASSVLWVEELRKLIVRRRHQK